MSLMGGLVINIGHGCIHAIHVNVRVAAKAGAETQPQQPGRSVIFSLLSPKKVKKKPLYMVEALQNCPAGYVLGAAIDYPDPGPTGKQSCCFFVSWWKSVVLLHNTTSKSMRLTRLAVSQWCQAFFKERLAGSRESARSGRPRGFPPRTHG